MSDPLVTIFGGSGFVGRHLVNRLAATGWRVRVAVRDVEGAKFLKPLGEIGQISIVEANIRNPQSVARAVEGAHAVVNLVGLLFEQKFPLLKRGSFTQTHVNAAASVAAAAQAAGVKHLIHMSVLGASLSSPSPNSRSRAEGEEVVKAVFPQAVFLRPSVIFGPEDEFYNRFASMARQLPILPYFIKQVPTVTLKTGGLPEISFFGDGGPRFQPVFVGDVVAAIAATLETSAYNGQTFELGGPSTYSFRQILQQVAHETRRNRPVLPVPLMVAKVAALALQYLPVPPLTPDQVIRLGEDNVVSGTLPGLSDLAIVPTPVESVIPHYLDNYRPTHRQIRRIGKHNA